MSAVDVSEEVASHGSKQNMIETSDLRVDIDHGQTKDKNNEDGVGVGRDEGKDREPGTRVDHTFSNLGILALSELLGGMTYSLLSPFYTKEATRKGCSVTETGIIRCGLMFHHHPNLDAIFKCQVRACARHGANERDGDLSLV